MKKITNFSLNNLLLNVAKYGLGSTLGEFLTKKYLVTLSLTQIHKNIWLAKLDSTFS
jgi:hypothetical protein